MKNLSGRGLISPETIRAFNEVVVKVYESFADSYTMKAYFTSIEDELDLHKKGTGLYVSGPPFEVG